MKKFIIVFVLIFQSVSLNAMTLNMKTSSLLSKLAIYYCVQSPLSFASSFLSYLTASIKPATSEQIRQANQKIQKLHQQNTALAALLRERIEYIQQDHNIAQKNSDQLKNEHNRIKQHTRYIRRLKNAVENAKKKVNDSKRQSLWNNRELICMRSALRQYEERMNKLIQENNDLHWQQKVVKEKIPYIQQQILILQQQKRQLVWETPLCPLYMGLRAMLEITQAQSQLLSE